ATSSPVCPRQVSHRSACQAPHRLRTREDYSRRTQLSDRAQDCPEIPLFVSYHGQASTGTTMPKPILKMSIAPTESAPPRANEPFHDSLESEMPARTVCTMIAGTRPKGTSSSANESVERLIQNNGRHSKVGSGPDRSRAEISIMTPQSANRPPTSAGK